MSGANPLLRPAFSTDAEAVAGLFAEAARAINARQAAALIEDASTWDDGWLLVGELEGAVVAIGSFRLDPAEAGTGVLGALVVAARRRRLGIAGALTGALEDEARRRGCARMVVGPEAESEDSVEFYRRRGYTATDTGLALEL
jgi:GNAT superfamily N-acetyltransferase